MMRSASTTPDESLRSADSRQPVENLPDLPAPLMPRPEAATSSAERVFALHEMFFSITDEKGIIRSGNDVFVRVSGYARSELVGRPHNVVRHPDMPRIVFKLLWDEIKAGRPIAAYVKNRASDGSFYWVMAIAVPTVGGYLSIRIKPSSGYFQVIQGVYRDLREVERGVEGAGELHRKEAMVASAERLSVALQAAGFETYDAFMRAAILAEVRAREEHLDTPHMTGSKHVVAGADSLLADALTTLAEVNGFLGELVLRLDEYLELNTRLAEKAAFVRGLADQVELFALNAIIAASKAARHDGAAIGAVAGLLRTRSESDGAVFTALGDSIAAAATRLGEMFFPVAAARLQGEMLEGFIVEIVAEARGPGEASDMAALHFCLESSVRALAALLTDFDLRLSAVRANVENLRGTLKTMRALSLNGRIEAARFENAGQFTTLFSTVGARIEVAWAELDELAKSASASGAWQGHSVTKIEAAVAATGVALGAHRLGSAAA